MFFLDVGLVVFVILGGIFYLIFVVLLYVDIFKVW